MIILVPAHLGRFTWIVRPGLSHLHCLTWVVSTASSHLACLTCIISPRCISWVQWVVSPGLSHLHHLTLYQLGSVGCLTWLVSPAPSHLVVSAGFSGLSHLACLTCIISPRCISWVQWVVSPGLSQLHPPTWVQWVVSPGLSQLNPIWHTWQKSSWVICPYRHQLGLCP